MEASTIPATAGIAPQRGVLSVGPLLRLRSDEQLVRLFRAGNEDAFRVIHDRYRTRLFAYARQMLAGSRQDAEDALQDVFVRAYGALRANDREVSLRAWLYRVAHNRCIDELRRPAPPPPETFELIRPPANDPITATEQRESLRRLVADVGRLPEQQRSALLMREISGMSYDDLAVALEVTVPAIKSLLVRARIGLVQASEARDTACVQIREALADSHERGVRASGLARRHMQDCEGCRAYRGDLRATRERLAALVPAFGPVALIAKLLGIGGGGAAGGIGIGAAGSGAVAGGTTAAVGAGAGAGAALGGGALGLSATHVVAAVAAAVVSAGGAVEVQRTLDAQRHRPHPPALVQQAIATPTPMPFVTPATAGVVVVDPADTPHARGEALEVQVIDRVVDPTTVPPDGGAVSDDPGNGGAGLPAELVTAPPAAAIGDAPPPTQPPAEEVDPTGTGAIDGAGASGAGGSESAPASPPVASSATVPPAAPDSGGATTTAAADAPGP